MPFLPIQLCQVKQHIYRGEAFGSVLVLSTSSVALRSIGQRRRVRKTSSPCSKGLFQLKGGCINTSPVPYGGTKSASESSVFLIQLVGILLAVVCSLTGLQSCYFL